MLVTVTLRTHAFVISVVTGTVYSGNSIRVVIGQLVALLVIRYAEAIDDT